MGKYYKVIKENFLWEVGAILEYNNGYRPVGEMDIWDKTEYNEKEYISSRIVENNPEYFQRVYASNIEKMLFVTKEALVEQFNKFTS